MRTGKLAISRGHAIVGEPAPAPRLSLVPAAAPRAPAAPAAGIVAAPPTATEYHAVHDRLAALERLARLFEQGALTPDEYAAEKAFVRGRPHESPASEASVAAAPRPSLLGRLLDWRLIPFGLATGLAFSFAAQPQETTRFVDEALRLLGA